MVLRITMIIYNTYRNTRKKLSKKPIAREQVKTVSKYDLQHSARRKELIAGSKRRAKKKTQM